MTDSKSNLPVHDQSPNGLPESALAAQAVAQILQPLARLMIGHGLQLSPMMELLKKALVDEALLAYGLTDKGSSDTRVALLTGVHRKDVKRLRNLPEETASSTPLMSVSTSVVARWISDPRYLNADQTTRALARTPRRGIVGETDFTTLVAEVSTDLGARAVLDELVRLGVVVLRDDGYVELISDAFIPKDGMDESFHFLATNVRDHLACAVHNLTPGQTAQLLLEQSAFAGDLSPHQAAQLQLRARQLWAAALHQFLQTATVAEERSKTEEGPRHKVRFGVYFHDSAENTQAMPEVSGASVRKNKRNSKL